MTQLEDRAPAGREEVRRNVARPYRVVRALKGGTIERNYPDGKKQKVEWKAGEVKQLGPDTPYVPKNVGKTVVVLYGVEIKQPK